MKLQPFFLLALATSSFADIYCSPQVSCYNGLCEPIPYATPYFTVFHTSSNIPNGIYSFQYVVAGVAPTNGNGAAACNYGNNQSNNDRPWVSLSSNISYSIQPNLNSGNWASSACSVSSSTNPFNAVKECPFLTPNLKN